MPDEQEDIVTRALRRLKEQTGKEMEDPRVKWEREANQTRQNSSVQTLNEHSGLPDGVTPEQMDKYITVLDDLDDSKDMYQDEFSFEVARLKVDILNAYRIFSGKMTPKVARGQTENIMISCPRFDHPDLHPSAWVNTVKNVWKCGGCEAEGDTMHLVAAALGHDMDLRNPANYRLLLEKMAPYLGFPYKVTGITGRAEFLRDPGVAGVAEPEGAGSQGQGTGVRSGFDEAGAAGLRVGSDPGAAGRATEPASPQDSAGVSGDGTRLGPEAPASVQGRPQDVQVFARGSLAISYAGMEQGGQVVPIREDGTAHWTTPANFSGSSAALGDDLAALLSADPTPEQLARDLGMGSQQPNTGAGLTVIQGDVSGANALAVVPDYNRPNLRAVPDQVPETEEPEETEPGEPTKKARQPKERQLTPDQQALVDRIKNKPPTINWRALIPENTFLHQYMIECCKGGDDVPEEFHFWNGLVAIGLMIGRKCCLRDSTPVFANLFVCTVAQTGAGKTRSGKPFKDLLRMAAPMDWHDPLSDGIADLPEPASGEALVDTCHREVPVNPLAPKGAKEIRPVTGFIEFKELSSMIERKGRTGSILSPKLLEFYDALPVISNHSIKQGKVIAKDAFVSVVTTTQPEALGSLLSNQDMVSGFINRFVFVMGPAKPRPPFGDKVIDTGPCVIPLQLIGGWAEVNGPLLNMSQYAMERYTRFHYEKLIPLQGEEQSGILTRLDLLCKKLLLLLTANMGASQVSLESVEQMIALFPYILETYGVVKKKVGITVDHAISDDIKDCIGKVIVTENPAGPTLSRIKVLVGRRYTDAQYSRALEYLVKSDEVIERTQLAKPGPGGGGRPTKRYTLNKENGVS